MTGTNGQDAGQPVLKTIGQAAAYLGISERTIRRYIKAGKLGTIDIEGQTRIQPADLDNLAAVSGTIPAVTGKSDRHMSGTVTSEVEESLKDTIRRQDSEISFLRTELTAIRTTLDKVTLMLPGATEQAESSRLNGKRTGKRLVWVWILLAVVILTAAGGGGYWLWLTR